MRELKIEILPEVAWGKKKDAIRIDPESGGVETQPATVKVDRRFEAFLVSKAVNPFLDRLDFGVQPFTHIVGDRMRGVRQSIGQGALDQMCDRPHQVQGTKGLEAASLRPQHIFLRVQPEALGVFPLQSLSAPGFLLPDDVHCFANMPHDVEVIEDDLPGSFRKVPEGCLEEGIPDIHRGHPDLILLFRRKRSIERLQGLGLHTSDRSLQKIAEQCHVLGSLDDGLSIPPDMIQRPLAFLGQAPLPVPFLDLPDLIPADPEKSRRAGNVARLQDVDRQALEQPGEVSPGFGPRKRHRSDSVGRTGDPMDSGMEIREEVAAVQMSPDPFLRVIEHRRLGSTFRSGKQSLRGMRHCQVHPLRFHVHRHRFHSKGGHNPQQILVQLRISHRPFLLHRGYR